MNRKKTQSNSVLTAVLFAAGVLLIAAFFGQLMANDTTPPTIDTPSEVKTGSNIEGTATDASDPVEVEMLIAGLVYATDTTSSGGVNSFSFSTTGIPAGTFVEIRAEDAAGNISSMTVKVVNCPQGHL